MQLSADRRLTAPPVLWPTVRQYIADHNRIFDTAVRLSRGWERFKKLRNEDGTISLRSSGRLFLCVLDDDVVRADEESLQVKRPL